MHRRRQDLARGGAQHDVLHRLRPGSGSWPRPSRCAPGSPLTGSTSAPSSRTPPPEGAPRLTGQARPPESRTRPTRRPAVRAGRGDAAGLVPMGYRRAAARPVPWSDIHPTQDGPDLTARRSASHRWSSHDSDPARSRPPRPASDRPLRPRRSTPTAPPEPTRCAGSPRRSAAARTSRPVPRRHRRVVRPVRRRPGRPVDVRRLADAR